MNIQKIQPKIFLSTKTAYLTGVIIGDGNLSNYVKSKKSDLSKDYAITIDISDREYLALLLELINSVITTKTTPKEPCKRGNRIPRLYLRIRNKTLFIFLNEIMEIPKGAKSSIVFVPSVIEKSSQEIKKYFLAGYFDTDGGFRGNTLGFTSASKGLCEGISKLLNEFQIQHSNEKWRNKKYNKEFYGIKITKSQIDRFLSIFPLQNKEKLGRIYLKLHAEVPERSNGIVGVNNS